LSADDQYAVNQCLDALNYSQANISGYKVGSAIVALNENGAFGIFDGCNIELATSKVWHAEEVALVKAISAGYRNILKCFVTSTGEQQCAACCGYCMQHLMYANPDCEIIVVNPDGSVKLRTTVRERNGPLAYLGKGRLD